MRLAWASLRKARPTFQRWRARGSVDGGDIGTDQLCGLLLDAALTAISMVLLKMRKRRRRRDWVHLVVTMIVKRHVHE